MVTHIVQLSNGQTLVLEERDDAVVIRNWEDEPGYLICQLDSVGVQVFSYVPGEVFEELTKGLREEESSE